MFRWSNNGCNIFFLTYNVLYLWSICLIDSSDVVAVYMSFKQFEMWILSEIHYFSSQLGWFCVQWNIWMIDIKVYLVIYCNFCVQKQYNCCWIFAMTFCCEWLQVLTWSYWGLLFIMKSFHAYLLVILEHLN